MPLRKIFPTPLLPLVSAVLCVGILVIVWRKTSSASAVIPDAYYSDDDGATCFGDIANRIPPFDHNGKQAVQADVYRRPDGKLFVGILERYTEPAATLVRRMRSPGKPTPLTLDELRTIADGRQFRSPWEKDWKTEPRPMPGQAFAPRTMTAQDGATGTLVTPESRATP